MPFQPTVVRGFSKYTRMTISSSPGVAFALGDQALGVLQRRLGVVDRAWADHHQQAVILPMQDGVRGAPGVAHGLGDARGGGRLADHQGGRAVGLEARDTKVVGAGHGGTGGFLEATFRKVRAAMKKPPGDPGGW